MSAENESGYGEFTAWEIRLAKRKAFEKERQLARHAIDKDDLEQEFLLHIWRKRKSYDENRERKTSKWKFTNHILENKFWDTLRAESGDKRVIHKGIDSLDRQIEDEDGNETTLVDLVREKIPDQNNEDLNRAINNAFKHLSEFQHELCSMIMDGYSLTEIAREKNKPWSSLKDEVIRMRQVLYDAGLKDFLEPRDLSEKSRIREL